MPGLNIRLLSVIAMVMSLSVTACTEKLSVEVDSSEKISDTAGGFDGQLSDGDQFGASVTNLGDLEVDGVTDLVVGAPFDDDGGTDRGAVWVLFMNSDGRVDIFQKISDQQGGFNSVLDNGDQFGSAVGALGDLNLDGFRDLVVGAPGDDDAGPDTGAVWLLFLNADGTVRLYQKISNQEGGFGDNLNDGDRFGTAVADIGDLNNDGIDDLAVGAPYDDDGGANRGAVWVLFMNNDGTVSTHQKISFTAGGFGGNLENDYRFGSAVTAVGDIDGNGVIDLAVGTPGDDDGGTDRGAVWLLLMRADGTVVDQQKLSQNSGDFDGTLADGDAFGSAVAGIGDIDGDGHPDLAVGADGNDDGGNNRGAVWILFLRGSGKVNSSSRISDIQGNFKGALSDNDQFGVAVADIGDLDGDGVKDIVTGANMDDDGGTDRGALWVLFMRKPKTDVVSDPNVGLGELFGGRR
jgi:hypothetical protein